MRDCPSCFGENGVQVADYSSSFRIRTTRNLASCIYRCRLAGKPVLITLTWSKNLMGHRLGVGIDGSSTQCLCKVEIKPCLFSKRKGFRSVESHNAKVDFYWDFSSARFGSGPEPVDGFYFGIVVNKQMILLVGDLTKEAFKRTCATQCPSNAIFIGKREQVFGRKVYTTRAPLGDSGKVHDLAIEYGGSDLKILVDGETSMEVKHLKWNFRGNQTIMVDGLPVQVFWDIHNWLFGASVADGVFVFKACFSADKLWAFDAGKLSLSDSQKFPDAEADCHGFSVVLYAWKNEQ